MVTLQRPLLAQSAADLMSHEVVLIPKEMSLPGAAHMLAQAQVSGAPVVDDEGRCIGVLSTTDFLHLVETGKAPLHHHKQNLVQSWQLLENDEESQGIVADYMNTDPVTVTPATHIGVLAHMMMDAHIHRVIVVDEWNHPIGIVSSTDILAAVAQAAAG
jgi:predicted transcriptional regulator